MGNANKWCNAQRWKSDGNLCSLLRSHNKEKLCILRNSFLCVSTYTFELVHEWTLVHERLNFTLKILTATVNVYIYWHISWTCFWMLWYLFNSFLIHHKISYINYFHWTLLHFNHTVNLFQVSSQFLVMHFRSLLLWIIHLKKDPLVQGSWIFKTFICNTSHKYQQKRFLN